MAALQLPGGDVHPHARDRAVSGAPRQLPTTEISTRLVKYPLAHTEYESRLLGKRDEVQRWQQPVHRMLPPDECLHPDDGAIDQPDDGLIVEAELSGLDGLLERRSSFDTGEHFFMYLWLEKSECALAVVLGCVQGQGGFSDHVTPYERVVTRGRDADARSDRQRCAFQQERLAECVDDARSEGWQGARGPRGETRTN